MRVTKYEHAALTVDVEGRRLVIDPGGFSASLPDPGEDVDAVVVTHEHPDHIDPERLRRLHDAFPEAPIFGPEGAARAVDAARLGLSVRVVSPGDEVEAGPFRLRFFGGRHEIIHSSLGVIDNVGVFVNETLYYPGDSYAVPPGIAVPLLAAPIGAPWLKIGDAIDFVLAVGPRHAFGTHDGTLSEAGLGMHRDRLQWATEQNGGAFHRLGTGESIDI